MSPFVNEFTEWIYENKRYNVFHFTECRFYLWTSTNYANNEKGNINTVYFWSCEALKIRLYAFTLSISAFLDGAISPEIEAI